jgi:hypothetical protein
LLTICPRLVRGLQPIDAWDRSAADARLLAELALEDEMESGHDLRVQRAPLAHPAPHARPASLHERAKQTWHETHTTTGERR